MLAGAGWLVITGGLLLVRGLPAAGPDYDAPLHALFVGFVMSAVLAHAPSPTKTASSPSTMALLTNPNAPAFTSGFFASLAIPNRPIGVANSGVVAAENSAQTSGSSN